MIGRMVSLKGLSPARTTRAWCSALAVVALFAVGCDAPEDEAPGERQEPQGVAEAASGLGARAETDGGRVDGDRDATGTKADERTEPLQEVGAPGGGSPLDDRAGPDPIPWHRAPKDTHTNEA